MQFLSLTPIQKQILGQFQEWNSFSMANVMAEMNRKVFNNIPLIILFLVKIRSIKYNLEKLVAAGEILQLGDDEFRSKTKKERIKREYIPSLINQPRSTRSK